MVDPLGRILTEIRDDAAVAALTTRIRGGEPAPGDALGPGKWQRFVVLVRLGGSRARLAPVQGVTISARCYGLTHQDAAALAGAVADAVHGRGRRVTPSGAVIFGTYATDTGGTTADPDTGQPYESVVIEVGALTEALA